jgi:DNA primase
LESGLVTEREPGNAASGVYDRFRNRITFPIRDERGRMAGFGARILDPNDVPKFLNSPQTPVFDKGNLLYGLDRARKSIRNQDQVVIVEGYLDVIALNQAGFENVVSPMGTALTEHHLYLLKKFTRRIVLALDPDAAGDKATLRGLQIARQAMDRQRDPVFDARGLLGYEARLQADIRVTTLPAGLDPDEIVNRDPAEWRSIVENARSIVLHVMETLAAARDLNDPKAKADIASQVLPLIEDVPSPVERDTYRQRLARLLKVDEHTLLVETRPRPSRLRRSSRPARQEIAQKGAEKPLDAVFGMEAHLLGVLLRRPDLLYRVDRSLQEKGLTRLSADDFQRADNQTIFGLIQASLDQDDAEPLNHVMNRLDLPLMDMCDDLLGRTEKMDPSDDRVLEDIMRVILDLRRRNLKQNIEHLRFLMEEAQLQGDKFVGEYGQIMVQYTRVQHRLDQAHGQYTNRTGGPR